MSRLISSSSAGVILSLALMLFFGFLMTRLTKKCKLPNVTAYIFTGILMGPYCLDLIPQSFIEGTAFLPDVALAFIAFSVGEYFKFSTLKKNGLRVIVITLFESLIASLAVFILTGVVFRLPSAFSVVLSALAAATAPASTMMTIRQTKAKGDLVDTLLQVVALDDVVGLLTYSIAISIAMSSLAGKADPLKTVLLPMAENLAALLLGALFGWLLTLLMARKHSTDNRLIIAVGLLFLFCGLCSLFDISPLLGCMMMGTVYMNVSGDESLFMQLNYFSPPILLLFFVRSGMSFRLDSLVTGASSSAGMPLLTIGIGYFLVRILGKYLGAWLGCLVTHKSKPVRRWLGLGLIPQAGVAIGLAAMCSRVLGGQIGSDLETVILSSSVLYELIGPASAKLALYLSGSFSDNLEDVTEAPQPPEGQTLTPVEELVARIQAIREEQKLHPHDVPSREEAAFTEAAYEASEAIGRPHQNHFINQ